MVHHSLLTNPYKMYIFERSVTCSLFQELYSHIDKNSGEKFENMFLVKITSKRTFLNENRDEKNDTWKHTVTLERKIDTSPVFKYTQKKLWCYFIYSLLTLVATPISKPASWALGIVEP